MRLALATLLLASCQGPDRWNTSIARGEGDIDGYGDHDYDLDEMTLEVGISGPIGTPPAPRLELPVEVYQAALAKTPPQPTPDEPEWIGPLVAAIGAVAAALAGVRYIPSKAFQGPFDKPKA